MSKFKVGDEVYIVAPGGALSTEIKEIAKDEAGNLVYFVYDETDNLGERYLRFEYQLHKTLGEAKAAWYRWRIERLEEKIKEYKKELQECLSK